MTLNIRNYTTLVFDCDGVVLDSNRIKTEAFRSAALPWGTAAAQALVDHHIGHGGVSRFAKFRHFIDCILPCHAPGAVPGRDGPDLEALLEAYAAAVRDGLLSCAVAEGLEALREATPGARWLIVSGGAQDELRAVFAARGLDAHFDGGIFGSPDDKDRILARELTTGCIRQPALFLGDSRYDLEAARRAGLDFVFVSGWTEVRDWPVLVAQAGVDHVTAVADLLRDRGEATEPPPAG